MTEYERAIENAWNKIREYCKETYAGVLIIDIRAEYENGLFGWGVVGVTQEGDAYIVHGDWTTDRDSDRADWFYHPDHKTGPKGIRAREMESVVNNWPIIKEALAKAYEAQQALVNFEA